MRAVKGFNSKRHWGNQASDSSRSRSSGSMAVHKEGIWGLRIFFVDCGRDVV